MRVQTPAGTQHFSLHLSSTQSLTTHHKMHHFTWSGHTAPWSRHTHSAIGLGPVLIGCLVDLAVSSFCSFLGGASLLADLELAVIPLPLFRIVGLQHHTCLLHLRIFSVYSR